MEGRRRPRRAAPARCSFVALTRAAGRPPPLPTLSHFPRVGAGSSLTSPGFGMDPLSRPLGWGRVLSHVPLGWGRILSHVPLGWGRILSHVPWGWGWILSHFPLGWGRVLSHNPRGRGLILSHVPLGWVGLGWVGLGWRLGRGLPWCAWSFFPWARAAGCRRPFRRSFTSPGGADPLSCPLGLGRMFSHVPGTVLCDGVHGGLFLVFGGVLWGRGWCFRCVFGVFGWCWCGFGVGVGRV